MSLIINDTAYAGTFASYFWLPAMFDMDTIQKRAVYVKDGIKKAHTIGRIDFSTPLQPRVATPVSNSNFTIDGRVLTPQDMMLYAEFNPRDFEVHWLAEQLSPTLLARELPVTAENYMLQVALNRAMEQTENGIWMGSTTYTAIPGSAGNGQLVWFDGFIKRFVNDAAVLKVAAPLPLTSGPSVAATSTNVLEALNDLITLAATNKKALLSSPKRFEKLKFFVSVATEQLYQQASVNIAFKGQITSSGETQPWKGFQVVALAGMPDNTIVFTQGFDDPASNLYVGMNSTEDNNLELKRVSNPSELFYIKGLMKYDVQYGFAEEVFLYTTLTAASFNV